MTLLIEKAKELCFSKWERTLRFLHKHPKCESYGVKETADSVWQNIPKASKEYWIDKADEIHNRHRMYTPEESTNR